MDAERNRPVAIVRDGNVFAVIASARKALRRAGQRREAEELQQQVYSNAKSYDEALAIISEYVEIELGD